MALSVRWPGQNGGASMAMWHDYTRVMQYTGSE